MAGSETDGQRPHKIGMDWELDWKLLERFLRQARREGLSVDEALKAISRVWVKRRQAQKSGKEVPARPRSQQQRERP
jgi:hypothetical protein